MTKPAVERFDIIYTEDGETGCPRVSGYPDLGTEFTIAGADLLVTPLEEIKIEFDYPLNSKVVFSFKSVGGFTLSKLWEAVYQGYTTIFKEEDETSSVKAEDIPRAIMNRPPTDGKYGVWGHDIEDLYFEGFTEIRPGVFTLAMGS